MCVWVCFLQEIITTKNITKYCNNDKLSSFLMRNFLKQIKTLELLMRYQVEIQSFLINKRPINFTYEFYFLIYIAYIYI